MANLGMVLLGGLGPAAVGGEKGAPGDWFVGVWGNGTATATFRISSWASASCLSSLAILTWSLRCSRSRPSTFC